MLFNTISIAARQIKISSHDSTLQYNKYSLVSHALLYSTRLRLVHEISKKNVKLKKHLWYRIRYSVMTSTKCKIQWAILYISCKIKVTVLRLTYFSISNWLFSKRQFSLKGLWQVNTILKWVQNSTFYIDLYIVLKIMAYKEQGKEKFMWKTKLFLKNKVFIKKIIFYLERIKETLKQSSILIKFLLPWIMKHLKTFLK